MEDRKAPGRRGAGADEREALAARQAAADKRERRADERDVLAGEQARTASERERTADDREVLADQREALADERERGADAREARADEREREADQRERELDERVRRLGGAFDSLAQRAMQAVARSRALLAASGERLDRQEAAVKRSQARISRDQVGIDRASAETERGLAAQLPDPATVARRSRALRKQALTAIEALAANEEETARIYEELAGSRPARRAYQPPSLVAADPGARRQFAHDDQAPAVLAARIIDHAWSAGCAGIGDGHPHHRSVPADFSGEPAVPPAGGVPDRVRGQFAGHAGRGVAGGAWGQQ